MEVEQLTFVRNGGETRRYHTWPVLRPQTVAEHSFHVAMLVAWLAGQEPPGIGSNLLMAALCHDLAEHKMGDIPAPVKRSMPDVTDDRYCDGPMPFRTFWDAQEQKFLNEHQLDWEATLSEQEIHWLKLADAADGCLYCIRERAMGNKLINEVYANFRDYTRKLVVNDFEEQLLDYVDQEWERACG